MNIKIKPKNWGKWIFPILLYSPAIFYWFTALMRVALGTDYFFDMIFTEMGRTFWGNLLLMIFVLFVPGIGTGIDGFMYIKKKDKTAKWGTVVGTALTIMGVGMVVKGI